MLRRRCRPVTLQSNDLWARHAATAGETSDLGEFGIAFLCPPHGRDGGVAGARRRFRRGQRRLFPRRRSGRSKNSSDLAGCLGVALGGRQVAEAEVDDGELVPSESASSRLVVQALCLWPVAPSSTEPQRGIEAAPRGTPRVPARGRLRLRAGRRCRGSGRLGRGREAGPSSRTASCRQIFRTRRGPRPDRRALQFDDTQSGCRSASSRSFISRRLKALERLPVEAYGTGELAALSGQDRLDAAGTARLECEVASVASGVRGRAS
jgi:hypothetical protein